MRNQRFFSLNEVKQAVSERLEEFNSRSFQKRQGSRRSAYLDEEQAFILPLPHSMYEPAVWTQMKVSSDYLVSDGKNKYSVPFDMIGEEVQVRLTLLMVEVFFNGSRVAAHQRKATTEREPVVNPEAYASGTSQVFEL